MIFDITASIVLYKNQKEKLIKSINSFLGSNLKIKLYLIDNDNIDLINIPDDDRIVYIKSPMNIGFGKAHNIAINDVLTKSKYHLVLNPDIYFDSHILHEIFVFMESNKEFGHLMPKILYPDGKFQELIKRNPGLLDFLLRRFFPKLGRIFFNKRMESFVCSDLDIDSNIVNVEYLSGCFMFLRTEILKEIGGFDDRYFMYMEDADMTRKILMYSKNIYYPHVIVYHYFEKGSHKSFRLMWIAIRSTFSYFNKWGYKL